jgi:catechol 2,3-dioxygenase-like lactoylglutathione lyase family enzyme
MSDVKLGQLGQIAMTVKDVDASVKFYRDVLGVPFLFQVPNMAFFDLDGVRLMITGGEGDGDSHGASTLYFRVDDLEGAHQALGARGVALVDTPHKIADMPDHELWMCFFRDPDGYLMGLMAEKPLPEASGA